MATLLLPAGERARLLPHLLRVRAAVYGGIAIGVVVFGRGVSFTAPLVAIVVGLGAVPLLPGAGRARRLLAVVLVGDLLTGFAVWWVLPGEFSFTLAFSAVVLATLLWPSDAAGRLVVLAVLLELLRIPAVALVGPGGLRWAGVAPGAVAFLAVLRGGGILVLWRGAWRFADRLAASRRRLEESRRRAQALLEAAPNAVLVFEEGRVRHANAAAGRLFGVSPATLAGRAAEELLPEETDPKARAVREAALRGRGTFREADRRLVRPDGVERIVEVAIVPAGDAVQAVLIDVTARHRAEERLRESERRYRSFFRRIPVPLYRTRLDGTVVDANPALAALLGLEDPAELIGTDGRRFYVDAAAREELAVRQLAEGDLVGQESRLRRADGTLIWVHDSSRVVETEEGAVFEGALVDVTARRRVEHELRVRARQQEAVAHLGRFALESPEIDTIFARSLEAIREVLGLRTAALLELRSGALQMVAHRGWTGDPTLRTRALASRTVASPAPVILRTPEEVGFAAPELAAAGMQSGLSILVPGAERPYGALWAFYDEQRIFSVDDVNFLVAVASLLAAAIDRHRSRRRLEELIRSKDEFLASVSHELRTPLTVVTGLANELGERWREFGPDEMGELTGMLAAQSQDLADLIEDLLVAARADIGEVTVHVVPLDLGEQVDMVLAGLGRDTGKVIVPPSADGVALADPVRFRQILRNLLTNAIRYGGEHIEVAIRSESDTVTVAVIDDGLGVPAADRERIFGAYERAHTNIGRPDSVGLGLAVSRTLAELMGGSLGYRYDGRCVFELRLPATDRVAAAEAAAGPAGA